MTTIEQDLEQERPFIQKLVQLMDLSFQLGKASVSCERYKDYLSSTASQQAEKDALFHQLITEFINRKPNVNIEYLQAIKGMLQQVFPNADESDLLKYSVDIYINEIKVEG